MKVVKRNGFYYLQHSFRKNGKVVSKDVYLGVNVPKDIDKRKESFFQQYLRLEVFGKLDAVKKAYGKEWKRIPPSIQKKMLVDLSIEFTYNTNAIEGSTITLEETEELIKRKIAPHKDIRDIEETLNHSELFFKIIQQPQPLTNETILRWHDELFRDTKPDMAGKYRDYLIRVGGYPHLIIEHKRRMSYYKALSKTEDGFLTYFIRRYLKAHQRYLKK